MKKILSILVTILLFTSQSFAQNQDNKIKVKDFINDVGNNIIKTADDKKLTSEQRKSKIIEIIDGVIDADWISRFVLGKNYKNISDENKAQFTKIYREFMINTYGPKFQNYNGKKFEVIDLSEQSGFYIAKAEFIPKDSNTAISVSFRVKERNGKLVILDFIAEGVSLIETQRSEFNSAISQKGIDNFLKDLTERTNKLKNQK